MSSPLLALMLLGVAGLAPGCGPDEPAVVPASQDGIPPGAVFRIDGHEYVTREEVDEWLDCMAFIETNASFPQLRRLSLTNLALPRAVARNIDRRAYEETRQRARAIHAGLLEGGVPGVDVPPSVDLVGTWKEVGMDVWWASRGMTVGEWSEPLESVGAFVIFRLVEASEEPWRPATSVRIERIFLPFLPEEGPKELVQQAIEASRIDVLDPEWEELLPLVYRNEMEAVVVEPEEGGDGNEEEP